LKAVSEEIIQKLKENIKELDKFLGAYPFDIWKQWKDLTNKIDSSITERCAPQCGFV
jgi:A1 cistron-splicing factor AAR2